MTSLLFSGFKNPLFLAKYYAKDECRNPAIVEKQLQWNVPVWTITDHPLYLKFYLLFLDINECNGRTKCSQLCMNTIGSYKCTCHNGYTLDMDGHTCHRKYYCIKDLVLTSHGSYYQVCSMFFKMIFKMLVSKCFVLKNHCSFETSHLNKVATSPLTKLSFNSLKMI